MKAYVLLTALWFAFCAVKGSTTITSMNTASTPTIITSITTPSPNDSGSSTITNMNTASTPTIITSITTPSPNDSANSTIANTNTTSIPTIITSITTPSQNDSATTTTTTNTTTTTFSITTPSQTTSAPLPCEKNPCTYYGAECINLVDQEYVCKCPLGWYYANTSGCQQGQIFPGDLSLNNIPYTPSMEDVNSKEYKELYYVVTQICQTAFEDQATYKQTIILSVKSSSPTLKRRREAERMASPVVSLINMFDKSTTLNSSTVQSLVENVLNGSSFVPVSQCDTQKICDSQTTDCTEKADNSIATCECKPGLAKKNPQDNYCSLCADCSQENNKQCIVKEVPQCQCMTGYYDKDGRCQECNFGYSGEDCKDNYVAVIVGVAVACGIVIVVLVGVLIYKSLSAKKKLKPERRSLLSHDYSATETHSESKSAASVAPKEKIFPRVQTKNPDGQGGPAKNADERGLANTAYLPEQDYDDADPSSFEMSTRSKF